MAWTKMKPLAKGREMYNEGVYVGTLRSYFCPKCYDRTIKYRMGCTRCEIEFDWDAINEDERLEEVQHMLNNQ